MGSKRSGQSFVLRFERSSCYPPQREAGRCFTDTEGIPSMRITTEYSREVYLVLKELQISSALPAEASASSVGSPKRSTCRGGSTWSRFTAITHLGEGTNQLPALLVQERHRCCVRQTRPNRPAVSGFIARSVAGTDSNRVFSMVAG